MVIYLGCWTTNYSYMKVMTIDKNITPMIPQQALSGINTNIRFCCVDQCLNYPCSKFANRRKGKHHWCGDTNDTIQRVLSG